MTFRYNAEIASAAMGETVPAEELWEVIPEHTVFSFSGYALPATFHEARIHIYPVSDFAAGGGAANTADLLRTLLDSGQLPAAGGGFEGQGIPFLPPFNAGQVFHVLEQRIDSEHGSGIRYLTLYSQALVGVDNYDIFYTYQGISKDGRYYIAAVLPINSTLLSYNQLTQAELETIAIDYEAYLTSMTDMLREDNGASLTPTLSALDAMMMSLICQD